jgi:hypothetical protein
MTSWLAALRVKWGLPLEAVLSSKYPGMVVVLVGVGMPPGGRRRVATG